MLFVTAKGTHCVWKPGGLTESRLRIADAFVQMLFFGSRCDRLCMMQFSLISLIPGLIRKLQDCADPELNGYEKQLTAPTNLRTSDRRSLQAYMGLPLQIFGKVWMLPARWDHHSHTDGCRRGACLARIRPCNNLMSWRMWEQSRTSWEAQIHYSSNSGIVTVTF